MERRRGREVEAGHPVLVPGATGSRETREEKLGNKREKKKTGSQRGVAVSVPEPSSLQPLQSELSPDAESVDLALQAEVLEQDEAMEAAPPPFSGHGGGGGRGSGGGERRGERVWPPPGAVDVKANSALLSQCQREPIFLIFIRVEVV